MRFRAWTLATAMAAAMALQPAAAATLGVLSAVGDKIYLVDSGSAKLVDTVELRTPSGPVSLNSIAVLPDNGRLIGVTSTRLIVEINRKTGAIKTIAPLTVAGLPPSSFACDPVEDECRLVSSFDAGQITFDPSVGQTTGQPKVKYPSDPGIPRIAGIAYTNAFAAAKKTELFDVDVTTKTLYKQDLATSVLKAVGKLGVNLETVQVGFAIQYVAKTKKNAGFLVYKKKLYSVDLKKGKAKSGKTVKGLPTEIKGMVVLN